MRVIVNPAAAGGRVGREWPSLAPRLGAEASVVLTEAPGHATELADEAVRAGEGRVVVVGGDGTVCEAAAGLLRAGGGSLGILPLGTGNDAARSLGIPRDLDRALEVVRGATVRRADIMWVDGHPVLNAIGVGLVGDINRRAARIKHVRGMGAYLAAAVASMVRYASPRVRVVTDDGGWDGDITMMAIHNGPTTGGGFALTPAANPWDGRLDLCLVPAVPILGRPPRLVSAMRGRLDRWPDTFTRQTVVLEIEHDEPLPAHLDGNDHELAPPRTRFEVEPGALAVAVPSPRSDADRI
jgi:YegS/Rv2252/BmrU family lipid kinase